jgi:hypothetical protein
MSYEGPELPVVSSSATRQRPRFVFYAIGCVGVLAVALIALMVMLDSLARGSANLVVDKKADLELLNNIHVPTYPEATYDEATIREIRYASKVAAGFKGIQLDRQIIALQVPADEKTTWAWYEKNLAAVGYKRTDKTVTIPFGGKKVEQVLFARGVQRLAVQVMPDQEFPGKSIVTFSCIFFAEPGRPGL